MTSPSEVRSKRPRQILLAALAAVWVIGGLFFALRLELEEFAPGESRGGFALRLGALVLQLLVAVSSTALLFWTRHQRASERFQRQHAEEFRQLFHNAVEAMFVTTSELRVIEVNDAAIRLTGYAREELLSRRLETFVPAGTPPAHPSSMAELLAGSRIAGDHSIVSRDGRQLDVEYSMQRLPDGRILGVVRDVTERRALERRLRLLSRALEESPAAMVITDITGRIEYVNPSFSRITGWSLSEAIGQTPALLKSGKTPEGVYQDLWETIQAGGEWSGELINKRKNGELFPWMLSIHPILDTQGRTEHFLGVGEDASERRATEAALAETRNELYQAQKMEALGRLAGGVAHDFNNLLGIILGYSDLLAGTLPEGSESLEELAEVRKAVLRAADLTRQLLAFGRRQVLDVRGLDLKVLLEDARKMLARVLPENISLRLDVAPDVGTVRADSTQLVQVLVNLALNARDAMPQGGELEIRADNVAFEAAELTPRGLDFGRYVRIRVRDTGSGMTPEVLQHAFEPFFTTKAGSGGTGLGLASVYGIVQQLEGGVDIESNPEVGTTVSIHLPRAVGMASGERTLPPAPLGRTPRATVLVVEDLAPLRKLVQRMLQQIGYSVLVAESADAALTLSSEGATFDLLLSDIVMPGMDGRDLAKALRLRQPGLKVVLMTGYSDLFAESIEMPTLGADAVVQKPFSRAQIEGILAEVLGDSNRGGAVS